MDSWGRVGVGGVVFAVVVVVIVVKVVGVVVVGVVVVGVVVPGVGVVVYVVAGAAVVVESAVPTVTCVIIKLVLALSTVVMMLMSLGRLARNSKFRFVMIDPALKLMTVRLMKEGNACINTGPNCDVTLAALLMKPGDVEFNRSAVNVSLVVKLICSVRRAAAVVKIG